MVSLAKSKHYSYDGGGGGGGVFSFLQAMGSGTIEGLNNMDGNPVRIRITTTTIKRK